MDVTRKEEYEIDPNSSFNRLRTLQKNLKEETALRENYSKSKDELLKTIDSHCYEYFKTKISIHELYDMPTNSYTNNFKYYLSDNSQSELPQCYDPLYKLLFSFRNDNSMMLKLISKIDHSNYDIFSTLISHLFYDNIFCSNQTSDELLLMIYLLIEKEINDLISSSSLSPETFLHSSKSFTAKVFNNLLRKNEVRKYMEMILSHIIIDFENLNNKTNEHNSYINLDLRKIKEDIIKDKKNKKCRKISNYHDLLTSKITYSNIYKKLNLKKRNNNKSNNDLYNTEKDVIDFFIFCIKKEEEDFTYKKIESYFEDNGLYDNKKRNDDLTEGNVVYNSSYERDLTKSEINEKLKLEKNVDMIEFYLRQIDIIQTTKDDKIFTITNILSDINNDKDLKDNAEKVILTYKYSFEKVKEYIDYILYSLMKHNSSIPYIIKYICCIIDKLISIKIKESSVLIRNTFICNFFFDNLILFQLSQPSYNGLVPELIISNSKRKKIELVTKVLKQLTKGQFFCSSNEKDKMYTMFNTYFIEIMPFVFEICKNLKDIKLPTNIETLIQSNINNNTSIRDINYNFFKENPNEFIELQSICFSLYDFNLIYDIIKENEDFFCPDKTNIFYKTYKKITFQEKTLQKKISSDFDKGKKTFLYLTKINYSDKVNGSVFAQKSQKFSFQSASEDMKENANEIFIFERVKYSINTIVKHLNTLTRANFSADSESMENFVKGLNTMIELEGFSEMLKEKTIPLDWFGLYLQSNIGGIPQSKSRANYYQLYSDLIDDSKANYNIIKSDETLNLVISKTKISEKNIEILSNMLHNYKSMLLHFQSAKFFSMETSSKICMKIQYKDGIPSKISIKMINGVCKSKGSQKNLMHVDVNNINQLIKYLPDLTKDTTETEILKYQGNINFPLTIERFFDSLKEKIKEEKILSVDNNTEFNKCFIEIQNVIYRKLHHKLYPEMASEKDVVLFRNCFNFLWIKPHNLNKELFGVNEDMLMMASEYVGNLINEISPYDKINSFAKAFEITQSTIKLYDIKEENADVMMLVYIFIKSQLMGIETNYLYIVMYLTQEQKNAYYDKLISYLGKIITELEHLSKEKLVDVSDEEYNSHMQLVYGNQ